jgi:hypothetical protein
MFHVEHFRQVGRCCEYVHEGQRLNLTTMKSSRTRVSTQYLRIEPESAPPKITVPAPTDKRFKKILRSITMIING